MHRLTKILLPCAVILILGGLAGCGQSGTGPLSSLSPTRSVPSRSDQPAGGGSPSAAPSAAPSAPSSTRAAAPVTPRPSAGSAGADSGSSSTPVWLWIIIALVVVGGAVTWIALAGRRRSAASAAAAARRSSVIDAYARGAALYDAMSVAETPGALVAADAGARWNDIQRRADSLAQALYALREGAPDESERMRAEDLLASLHAVRSAMDAERAPTGGGQGQAEVVRGRLFNFGASLRAFRAADVPAS